MEVIQFGTPNDRPPLLFVHGSYCGAWVWTRYFLPAFAQAGWHGAAISLRGHGESEGQEGIGGYRIVDYLEDIEAGAKFFHAEPILIGHSLGGYLAQKYALERAVKGLVLLAAPSLLGMQGSVQHVGLGNPLLAINLGLLMTMGPTGSNLQLIAESLFSSREVAEQIGPTLPLLQRESSRLFIEANWPDFRSPPAHVPTLALIGDIDAFVPEFDSRYEAQSWHGKSKVLPGVPHGMMLDPCWPDVAREIMGWLISNFVAS